MCCVDQLNPPRKPAIDAKGGMEPNHDTGFCEALDIPNGNITLKS